jgi:hypothetical protein
MVFGIVERRNLPHCVQYCQVQLIMAGSVKRRFRSQLPEMFALPEQSVSRYEFVLLVNHG